MKVIEFISNATFNVKGEVAGFDDRTADSYISKGYAKLYVKGTEPVAETTGKVEETETTKKGKGK